MKAGIYVVLALLIGVYAKEDKTITKVVKLLQEMMEKSKEEGDEEKNLYGKFKCYCDTNDAEKKDTVASLEKKIDLLSSAIDSLQSENGELSAQTSKLKADMASNTAGQDEATNVRDKSKQAFTAEETDLKAAVGQMDEAIKVLAAVGADQTLGKSAADHDKFMAGTKVAKPLLVSLSADVKKALAAASIFLNKDQKKQMGSFLQGPSFTGSYTSQSAQIIGILKDMRDTFKTNLADSTATEKKEKDTYDKFMTVQKEAFDSMEKVYNEKQEKLGSNDGALTSKKTQLQTATTDLADAEEFLTKLTTMCVEKAKQHEARSVERANEEAAIAEAISILNSDSAFETFATVDATSTGKTNAASFLQLGVRRNEAVVRRQLEHVLSIATSSRLTRVLATVEAGNPFEKVLKEITKMVKLNEEEGKEDKKNLDWCTGERKENNENLDARKDDIRTLGEDIDTLEGTINDPVKGLKNQLAETEASLVQNNENQVSETKERTETNVAYQADVKNLVDAEDVLGKAIAVLSEYYDKLKKTIEARDAAMVQEDPAPPDTWDASQGQGEKGGDAITMLQYILTETQKEETTAHTQEEKAQADYEDSMTDLKKGQGELEKTLVKLQEDLATEEKNLIEKKEDLKDATSAKVKIEEYLVKIKPGCDFITTNFDQREANRKTETDALDKAVELIKKTPAYLAAAQAAKEEGFGKCKTPCLKNEAGKVCKACQARVTVPAYCAGHPDTVDC